MNGIPCHMCEAVRSPSVLTAGGFVGVGPYFADRDHWIEYEG